MKFLPARFYLSIFTSLALTALISGCGSLEWPSSQQKNTTFPQSSSIFTNATAVIVGPGDTVYALSRRHSVSQRDIIIANDLKAPYQLIVGQRIVLPRGTVYTVVKGNTLGGIAKTYDVDLYELARANNIGSPYTIYPGQQLRIPGTGTQTAAKTPVPQTASTQPTEKVETSTLSAIPTPPPSTEHGFIWPLDGKLVSGFGAKEGGLQNDGINIAAAKGSSVRAAENGVVAYAGNELRGFGNLLLVKHANGYITAYAHNDTLLVGRGDKVTKGQGIATVGSTGNVSSPQLHFELRKGKKPLDPREYLPKPSA